MEQNTVKIKDGKINFSCRMSYCQHSCCGPFCGITSQLSNIENRPFEEIVLTEEDYRRIYGHGYADLIEDAYSKEMDKEYFKMALEPDGSCKALRDGCCTINDIKPTLCRAFPFYFDMFSGLCAINCEGFSDDSWVELSEYKDCFEAARKMYEFWLKFYTPKNEE